MKKVFILGASMLQIPAIKKAKEKGLYVYALDYDPDALGIKYADEFLCISTIDKEEVYKAALKYRPDYIITSTSDMPVRTVSWVNEKLGKPTDLSYDDAICATDKGAMRKRMKENNVPIPDFFVVKDEVDFARYFNEMPNQFIVKPADNAASRGVILVNKNDCKDPLSVYKKAVKYSRGGDVLIEEYMNGPEVSVESYTVEGETSIISITDKIVSERPFFVEYGHTEPSRLSNSLQEKVIEVAKAAIKAIGMHNGPNHTEIIITDEGPKLVEIAARLGGDFITSKLVPLSTGIDMVECSFNTLLNEKVNLEKTISRGAAIRFLHGNDGILNYVEGVEAVKGTPNVIEIEIYKKHGDIIKKPENSSDRIGHVIAIGNSADEAAKTADEAVELINIVYM